MSDQADGPRVRAATEYKSTDQGATTIGEICYESEESTRSSDE
jgi:hypothetical protein